MAASKPLRSLRICLDFGATYVVTRLLFMSTPLQRTIVLQALHNKIQPFQAHDSHGLIQTNVLATAFRLQSSSWITVSLKKFGSFRPG